MTGAFRKTDRRRVVASLCIGLAAVLSCAEPMQDAPVLLFVPMGDLAASSDGHSTPETSSGETSVDAPDSHGVEADGAPAPCAAGTICPCDSDAQCGGALGSCVVAAGFASPICAAPCGASGQACPVGTTCAPLAPASATAAACLPPQDLLCHTCSADLDCGPGGLCVPDVGGAARCGRACVAVTDCPSGYRCQIATGSQGTSNQCLPETGLCPCSSALLGVSQPCLVTNPIGECAGRQSCSPSGWTPCDAPAAVTEACNGLDDDCDGQTDDGFADTDADGASDCVDKDDDADGIPDSGDLCPTISDPVQLDADGDLLGDVCDPDDDNDGSLDTADCAPLNPTVHPGQADLCDGQDEDCSGVIDDPFSDHDADGIADCIDPDDDQDGIVDGKDVCPTVANPTQTNTDGDSLGDACDPDDDNDGAPDSVDCAPTDAAVHPGAIESCNGKDDDCGLGADEGWPDTDGDGSADCVDADADGDGLLNIVDLCPLVADPGQLDSDLDGAPDACDGDDDDDGVVDALDCAPLDPLAHPGALDVCNGKDDDCNGSTDPGALDTDLDGVPDCVDSDDDGDGIVDAVDVCPLLVDPGQENIDKDLAGDACDSDDDNDLWVDALDCAPGDPKIRPGAPEACDGKDNDCDGDTDELAADTDGDNAADCLDDDDDNDGVLDVAPQLADSDNCPLVKNSDQSDWDGDGLGDPCDPDVDGDGVANGKDSCALVKNPDQADQDQDGLGDPCDADRDGDGLKNTWDNCVALVNPEQVDLDFDGLGDVCDSDDDGDGVDDLVDCQPQDPLTFPGAAEACNGEDDNCNLVADEGFVDHDLDGKADCSDLDDDADGVLDVSDNCPLVANAGQDNGDGDPMGDACDADDDGDGTDDGLDNCPVLSNAGQADLDNDGRGDACDADDDGDGVADTGDNCPLLKNGDQLNTDGDPMGNACDADDDGDAEPDLTDCKPLDKAIHHGAAELCNGVDDDCSGKADEGNNGCGGVCPLTASPGVACDGPDADKCADDTWQCTSINAVACATGQNNVEVCNAADDDCNGVIDEGCPCTVKLYASHRYYFCGEWKTWAQARDLCVAYGGALTALTSAEENTWVMTVSGGIDKVGRWWTGGNDLATEGAWTWASGEAFGFKAWNKGEPNDTGKAEDCLELWRFDAHTWNDEGCGALKHFICELP